MSLAMKFVMPDVPFMDRVLYVFLRITSYNVCYTKLLRDPEGKSGTANIAGEMLLTGTRMFPREELIRLRSEEQVSIRAQTSVDWFTVASVFPAEMLDQALLIEGDRLEHAESSITVEVFDAIRAALQREHERRRNNFV